jgi:RNA polymerase sigma-70 factor, ECF subfamily
MDEARLRKLCARAGVDRWSLAPAQFAEALDRSAAKAFAGRHPSTAELERYFDSLHLADLALACACASGIDSAWDHFVTEFRPSLYRAADAIDAGGGAREIADALYGELFGVRAAGTARKSPFDYFHGRSSLSTWLRSLLSQRFIDRHRQTRRLAPLPEDSSSSAIHAPAHIADPDRGRYVTAMRAALGAAIVALAPRDRLRLACYYAQEMTLAQIGALTREHEATVSRQLARTRRDVRNDVERRLRDLHGFSDPEIAECFTSIVDDAGNLDLEEWLGSGARAPSPGPRRASKNSAVDRSRGEDHL